APNDPDAPSGSASDETAPGRGETVGPQGPAEPALRASGPAPAAEVPPPVPENLLPPDLADHPRYQILQRLGAGGMGTVYLAGHRLMNRAVALKAIHPHLVGEPGVVERFRREAQAAARLSHPNIVTAYDADEAGGTHILVMEFVEGLSLDVVLADHARLPVEK